MELSENLTIPQLKTQQYIQKYFNYTHAFLLKNNFEKKNTHTHTHTKTRTHTPA